MEEQNYIYRIGDRLLEEQMQSSGAVLIEGAKWCGKTSTGKHLAKSILYMQDPDEFQANMRIAESKPSLLLRGENPRLIDEWQMAPVLWDAVRFEVDKRGGKFGQFILTGSAVPKDNETMHTGTGRISRILLRPMTLFESKESNGDVSLKSLFDGNTEIESFSTLTIEDIAHVICRGGWPAAVVQKAKNYKVAENYVEAVINMDVHRVDGVEKNPQRVRMLMKSLSRNISTLATLKTIQEDVQANDMAISENTLNSYLNALRRIFVVEDIPAWQPSLRSKTAIRTSAKRQFVDPSIATAVLKAKPDGLLKDFELFGFLFESLCTRDIRVYSQANDGEVLHYRDKNGLESDLIIRLNDGRWAAIEVKMGNKQVEQASKNLIKLKSKVDTDKIGEPSFLMVITAGQYAYKDKNGVLICPVGCLKD
ncbi:MAG: ATP-binding protein [Bacteroidales bacterium]|nr:ATP-binding protein [Bacteroidales bacterium]